jgi:Fe2+ or Zn2+ uptake regulation protein
MKINIFINDKLYKTINVQGDNYNPSSIYPQIEADKQSGLLHSFNIGEQMSIKVEKVKN